MHIFYNFYLIREELFECLPHRKEHSVLRQYAKNIPSKNAKSTCPLKTNWNCYVLLSLVKCDDLEYKQRFVLCHSWSQILLLKDSSHLQWTLSQAQSDVGKNLVQEHTDLWKLCLSQTNGIFHWFVYLQIALRVTIRANIQKCDICQTWGGLLAVKDQSPHGRSFSLLHVFSLAYKKILCLLFPLCQTHTGGQREDRDTKSSYGFP